MKRNELCTYTSLDDLTSNCCNSKLIGLVSRRCWPSPHPFTLPLPPFSLAFFLTCDMLSVLNFFIYKHYSSPFTNCQAEFSPFTIIKELIHYEHI